MSNLIKAILLIIIVSVFAGIGAYLGRENIYPYRPYLLPCITFDSESWKDKPDAVCGVFKPGVNQKEFDDGSLSKYYKVYSGDYIALFGREDMLK